MVGIYCRTCADRTKLETMEFHKAHDINLLRELMYVSDAIYTVQRLGTPVTLETICKFETYGIGAAVADSIEEIETIIERLIQFIQEHRDCFILNKKLLLVTDGWGNYFDIDGNQIIF